MSQLIRRGDAFWANLDPTVGVEIKKKRPVVVVSNDVINQRSRLVIVVPLTTNIVSLSPSHVLIPRDVGALGQDSKVLTEQIRAIDKQRLVTKIGVLPDRFLRLLNRRFAIPWTCEIMRTLASARIPSRPYFTPIHLQPFYREKFGYQRGDFPITEYLGDVSLALPFSGVMTEEQVDSVCQSLIQRVESLPS